MNILPFTDRYLFMIDCDVMVQYFVEWKFQLIENYYKLNYWYILVKSQYEFKESKITSSFTEKLIFIDYYAINFLSTTIEMCFWRFLFLLLGFILLLILSYELGFSYNRKRIHIILMLSNSDQLNFVVTVTYIFACFYWPIQ